MPPGRAAPSRAAPGFRASRMRARRVTVSRIGFMSISPICSSVCAFPILAAAAPTGTPGAPPASAYMLLIVLGVVALAIATCIGALNPARVDGPDRLEPNEPPSPLWLVTGIAIFLWLFVPATYGLIKVRSGAAAATTAPATSAVVTPAAPAIQFSGRETVGLVLAGPGLGLLAILVLTPAVRRRGFGSLGARARDLPRALCPGLIGVFIVLPLMFWVILLTQVVL